MNTSIISNILALALLLVTATSSTVAQNGGGHILYGDFKVDESKATGAKPLSFDVILYTTGGDVVSITGGFESGFGAVLFSSVSCF